MKYYSTQQPITPGSYPKSPFNDVLQVVNFDARTYCEDIGREAWGYIEYKKPLHPEDVEEYELAVIPSKIIEVVFVGVDDFGRYAYKDRSGKLWKYADPGDAPLDRHEELNHSTGDEIDGEPGWPMEPDMDYRIVEAFTQNPVGEAKKSARFKHTEQTAKVYNSMIKEYREISCDSDLERAGLTYDDYNSSDFGFFLDSLRFDGIGSTSSKDVAEWAKRHGCFVTEEKISSATKKEKQYRWTVRLQEVENEAGN